MPPQTRQCAGQDFEDLDLELLVKPLAPPKTPVQSTIEVLITPRLQAMRMIFLRNGGKSWSESREHDQNVTHWHHPPAAQNGWLFP